MKMDYVKFLETVNSLELDGSEMLRRKIGESEKAYKARKNAFTIGLSDALNKLDYLIELIGIAREYYNSNLRRFESLNDSRPVFEFIYPDIKKWDSVEEMHTDLDTYIRFYTRTPELGTSNFYFIARDIKPKYMAQYRKFFIERAITDIPPNRKLVFIKSPYEPYYEDERLEEFYDVIESLKETESAKLARIYDVNKLEWFCFCVDYISPERIEYLSEEWTEDPKFARIVYI